MNPQFTVYVSLGSNQGDKFHYLQQAIDAIFEKIGNVVKISPVYQTASWGFEGEDFFNAVILIQTSLTAEETLDQLLLIEKKSGRIRSAEKGYAARTLDLDILFYENEVIKTEVLTVPHPHLENRRFVLQPLQDIAPDFIHPVSNKNTSTLLEKCEDEVTVEKLPRWLKNPLAAFSIFKYNFITIEGNIGAGKTSLVNMIATDFNAKAVLERFADNPFLPRFYEDKSRYAFPLEMSFLADRYQQVHDDLGQLDLFKEFIVADYDIYKSLIFSKVTLQEEEFKLYRRLFELMYKDIKRPGLYVFLFQSTEKLLENISKRGRDFERSISAEYLESIQKGYLDFIRSQPDSNVKIIDITQLDFIKNRKDYLHILKQIGMEQE